MIFIREQNEVTHICPQRMQFVVLTKRTAASENINFDHGCAHAQPLSRPSRTSFSSPEATLLLVSTKNRDLWLTLAKSNTGSPRFTDLPSLCACSESSLTNLIGSGLNLLCLQSHSKTECRWTRPEVSQRSNDWAFA